MTVDNDPVKAEYSQTAKDYDEKWSFYVEATTRHTLERMPVQPSARVLDVGCGTGELLYRLGQAWPDSVLTGVDPAPEMLAIASRKLASRAQLQIGYADALPWPDGSFDTVVTSNVFHYITHPMPALSEMKRVLRYGGKVVITDWCDDYLACRFCSAYLRITDRAYYKTYGAHECSDLLTAARFAAVEVERYKISWLWGLMTAVGTKT